MTESNDAYEDFESEEVEEDEFLDIPENDRQWDELLE